MSLFMQTSVIQLKKIVVRFTGLTKQ